MVQARANWAAGRFDAAEDALARLSKVRPLKVEERLLRSQVARDRGRIDDAVAALGEPASGATPAEAALLASSLGTLELLHDRFRPAEAALTRALSLDPGRDEARRELINLYALQGRQAELASQFKELARAAGTPLTFADLYLWALGRHEDLGPADLAEALGRAVRADPGDRLSRLALAENLRRLGRIEEAGSALEPLPTSDTDAQTLRARLAVDRGEVDQAETWLATTTEGGSASLARLRLLGQIALIRGEAGRAVRAFREALQVDDSDRDALFGLGQALRIAGDPRAALPYSRAARDRDHLEWLIQSARTPAARVDAGKLRAIADACLTLRRRDEALAWLRLALSQNPLDRELQKALFRVDHEDATSPSL